LSDFFTRGAVLPRWRRKPFWAEEKGEAGENTEKIDDWKGLEIALLVGW